MVIEKKLFNTALARYRLGTLLLWLGILTWVPFIILRIVGEKPSLFWFLPFHLLGVIGGVLPGEVAMTWPFGYVLENWSSARLVLNPASCSCAAAASGDLPRTSGTSTGACPLLTINFACVSGCTCWPGFGVTSITLPAATSDE